MQKGRAGARLFFMGMLLIGLTGGVGMGKTTSAEFLRERGIPVIDTDLLARQVVEPGQPALRKIEEVFGAEMIQADGTLNRELLARHIFSEPIVRKKLEEILHPPIRQLWQRRAEEWRSESRGAGVVVIPLLFETAAEPYFDMIVCTACTGKSQGERLAGRGWRAEQIEKRITAQWPVERKMLKANYVIWAEGPMEVHREQIERICQELGV
jgi:dephospho-CoA kinase